MGGTRGTEAAGKPALVITPISQQPFPEEAGVRPSSTAWERQTPCPQGQCAPRNHARLTLQLDPPLRRQQQRPSPQAWRVSQGITDRLWVEKSPQGPENLTGAAPQERAGRNSWLPADPTGLHRRGSSLLRSGNYSRHYGSGVGEYTYYLP